ncbi:hypothetical protein [Glycomyces sp. YM15]|uniref:hypothetical protein n=1 Tax=Glycomyces sp. YM15 TaxID=2800446 RepID=UPI001962DC59|nr:hypothetical protein [Glycomyces sp. YM15]
MTAESLNAPSEPEPEPVPAADPDPHPDNDGWLGTFHRGPAVFSVFREVATDHPLTASEYRIECNDGAGPRVICQFFDDPEPTPEWFGAWKNDQWCPWILKRAFRLIAKPEST